MKKGASFAPFFVCNQLLKTILSAILSEQNIWPVFFVIIFNQKGFQHQKVPFKVRKRGSGIEGER